MYYSVFASMHRNEIYHKKICLLIINTFLFSTSSYNQYIPHIKTGNFAENIVFSILSFLFSFFITWKYFRAENSLLGDIQPPLLPIMTAQIAWQKENPVYNAVIQKLKASHENLSHQTKIRASSKSTKLPRNIPHISSSAFATDE